MLLADLRFPFPDTYAWWVFIGVDGQACDPATKIHPAAAPPGVATFRRIRLSTDSRPHRWGVTRPAFLAFEAGGWSIVAARFPTPQPKGPTFDVQD